MGALGTPSALDELLWLPVGAMLMAVGFGLFVLGISRILRC